MKTKHLFSPFSVTSALVLLFLVCGQQKMNANTPPVAMDMDLEFYEGIAEKITLSGSDEETSAMYLEFKIIDGPDHGSIELDAPDAYPAYSYLRTYTPDDGYIGTDQFTFRVYDDTDSSDLATVTININENNPPEAEDLSVEAVTSSPRLVGFPVSDDATPLSDIRVIIVTPPGNGEIEPFANFDPDYRLKNYRSNPGFTGTDSFTYKAIDGQGNESEVKTVTVDVLENTPPLSYPSNIIVMKNAAKKNNHLHYFDPDETYGQEITFEVTDGPDHGTITGLSDYIDSYTYTPDKDFTGIDKFTIKAYDSVEYASPREIKVLVLEPGEPNGSTVLVVIPESHYNNLKTKTDRLLNDLNNEGYHGKLKIWTGGNNRDLWDYLQSEYRQEDQFVSGAILIGKSLPSMQNGDIEYWNLRDFSGQGSLSAQNDVWVSRFEEDDFTKLGYALDANHRYRTGQSRVPHDAYRALADDYTHDPEHLANLENVWDTAIDLPNSKVDVPMTEAAEIVYRSDHNAPKTGPGPYQCRFAFISGCSAGNTVGKYQFTREGSNLLSVARKDFTGPGYYAIDKFCKDDVADLLNNKAAWGNILNQSLDTLPFKHPDTYYFGDLSLPVKNTPPGVVPVIDEYNAGTTSLMAGEKVDFSVTITDPDAGDDDNPALGYEHKVEWFLHEYFINEREKTYQDPVITTTSNQPSWDAVSYTFDQPHNYNTRVEVQDEWHARAWKHKEIIVKPNPLYPLRINLGTYSGHDTYFPDYTDDDGNVWLYQEEYNSGKGNWGWQDGGCGRSSNNGKPIKSEIDNSEIDPVYWYWNNICDDGPSYLKVPLANDTYTVNIHVADMKSGGEGERLLDAWIEGNKVMDGFDAYKEAGSKMAVVESFTAEVTDGELTIKFQKNSAGSNDAMVNAIEILPRGINTYTITASANTGGTISPSGAVSVPEGSGKTFIIEPAENHEVADVEVNGESKGAVTNFTFKDVDADQTIAVTFREVEVPVYTITASAGMNGKISPLGEIQVEKGAGQSFTITPDAEYKVSDVKIDNVSQGVLTDYEFTDVTDNHSIEAIFEKDTSTSISSGKNPKDKLNVYPIPFEGHLYIEGLDKGKAVVTMYDINGTVVLEKTIETTGTLVLEGLQHLEKGIYLINIQQEKRNSNIKVIK